MRHINQEMKRFNHLMTETEAAYHEVSLKMGFSDSAMQILYAICENGESCLLGDITRLSGMRKQTIGSALRRLEEDGIVFLEAAGGKAKRVCLTKRGKQVASDTVYRILEIEDKIFSSWEKQELDMYIELTRRYLAAFREETGRL